MRKNIAFAAAAALVALGGVAFADDSAPNASPQARQERMDAALSDARAGRPATEQSVGSRARQDAASAGQAVRNGAHRAGHAVSHAASATGTAIGRGVHRTGRAIHNATHRASAASGAS